jgi:thioredoxin 1
MAALHIKQDEFKEKVLSSKVPVLVDFYAEWCGPCQMAAPVLDELADAGKDKYQIVKVDVDENRDLAGSYGVMSIPTVVLFKDGKEVTREIGFRGKQGYVDLLSKAS